MAGLISGDVMRVLLVSPSAAVRSELGDALAGAGELRYYWISQPDLALVRGQNLSPHVIVVDDELGDVDPGPLVRELAAGVPGVVLVALVRPDSIEAARDMVLNGARAILTKPIQPDLLMGTLRQSLGRRELEEQTPEVSVPTGRMVAFCGSKGGTGRTTLAINTAVSLVDVARETVVIIDADYSAPAIDVALDLHHQRDITDLLPKLSSLDADLMDSVLATHSSGVRVLMAPMPEAGNGPPTEPQIEQIISWLRRMYAWVLVDLGLPIDEAGYAYLDQSDRIIMSVLPEMVGLRNAKTMLRQFTDRGYPSRKLWPLVNREGLRGSIPTGEVEGYLERAVKWTVPNDQELATETINRGVPMVISHRRRPLAQRYRALARELVDDRHKTLAPATEERFDVAMAATTGIVKAVEEPMRSTAEAGAERTVSSAAPAQGPKKGRGAAGPSTNSGGPVPADMHRPQPSPLVNRQELAIRVLAGIGGLGIIGGLVAAVVTLLT